jgi:hypothetical protein
MLLSLGIVLGTSTNSRVGVTVCFACNALAQAVCVHFYVMLQKF